VDDITGGPDVGVDAAPEQQYEPLPWGLAVVVVVGTSGAVLVLEILAGRLLAPYVGVSLETYAGIIGTVLAGIAIGAWLGGVAADHVDPRRLIPVLLVVGGALAIATVPTVRVVGDAGIPASVAGSLLLTAIGFLPSATVLSAIPPAVVKLQLRDLHNTGATVGRLSAYGTAGAIVATFLTGFVLVAVAAVTTIIIAVGVVLVLCGLALWATLPTRQRRAAGAEITSVSAFAGIALVAATAIGSPCDSETTYYCVTIVAGDSPTAQVLVLDDLRHSYIDRDDPTHLGFWYTRRFAEVVERLAPDGALDVVHIGGGALTVPTWLQTVRPDADQTVFEIDDGLIDLVVDEFDRSVGPGTGVDVIAGDGRLSLRQVADDAVDVVLGDAFGSRAVPWHLTTQEFVADVARVLRPGGFYALNAIDGAGLAFLRAEAATIASVFTHVEVMLSAGPAAGGRGNAVIIASDRPFDANLLDPDGGRLVADVAEFIEGATVLSDDFAPVDQLLTPAS
jgi:SAM-dependent methyltransferase